MLTDVWGPGQAPAPPRPSSVWSRRPHDDPTVFTICRNLPKSRFRRGAGGREFFFQPPLPGYPSWAIKKPPTPKIGAEQHTRPVSFVCAPARTHAKHTHACTHARTQFLQTSQDRGRRRGCSRDELDELEDAGDAEDAQDLQDADDARVAVRRAVAARVEAVLRRGAAPLGDARRRRGGGVASGLADFLNMHALACHLVNASVRVHPCVCACAHKSAAAMRVRVLCLHAYLSPCVFVMYVCEQVHTAHSTHCHIHETKQHDAICNSMKVQRQKRQ